MSPPFPLSHNLRSKYDYWQSVYCGAKVDDPDDSSRRVELLNTTTNSRRMSTKLILKKGFVINRNRRELEILVLSKRTFKNGNKEEGGVRSSGTVDRWTLTTSLLASAEKKFFTTQGPS